MLTQFILIIRNIGLLVFIDESGCPGFKLSKGSSQFFIIGMVLFEDKTLAYHVSQHIADLRKKLRVAAEFKFSKTHNSVKDIFFETLPSRAFKIRALVVNKSLIHSTTLRTDVDSFYHYFMKKLVECDNGVLCHASITVDGSGDREFKRELSAYIRKCIPKGKIKNFQYKDSKKVDLLQLADMCVGAIARNYEKKNSKWLNILREKNLVNDIWNFK